MFKGPNIQKVAGSLGARAASKQNIFGIVFGGILPGGGATYTALGQSKKLIQASDADALGFTAAYDSTNKILVRYHIDRFFKRNPNGTLWIQLVAQGTSMKDMCDYTKTNGVKKLVNDSGKTVKTIGVVLNPANAYSPTLTGGVDQDVTDAIPMAQDLTEQFLPFNCYLDHIVIEGRQVNGAIGSIVDLSTQAAPNVHVCIYQDADVAGLDARYAKHAAVGDLLGMIGIRRIEEDYGSINVKDNPNKGQESFPLGDGITFVNVALSSGALVSTLTAPEVQTLRDNAFIFADTYPEYDGYYLNGSPSCTDESDDFRKGPRMRIWNAGARLVTKKLIPLYNSDFDTTDDGFIDPLTASDWQAKVNNTRDGLGTLAVDGHCKKTDVFIPTDTALDPNNAEIEVDMSIAVKSYVDVINGKLKLTV